ncbi:MAG: CD225/dispanin family protein [Angustibacter sp.]
MSHDFPVHPADGSHPSGHGSIGPHNSPPDDFAANGPGHPRPRSPQEPAPDNYLIFAVLSLIFCCLPTGVVSVIYAAQVNGKHYAGDFSGARAAGSSAKSWAIISVIAFFVIWVLPFILTGGTLLGVVGLTDQQTP